MTVHDLYCTLDKLYPRSLSCSWDNDGLMVCADLSCEVKRVLLALDATNDAIAYAVREGCQVLLTHHPMLFRPLKNITPDSLNGERTLSALKADLAVISLHTRLDAGGDGVNDALVDALGLTSSGTFGDDESPALGRLSCLEKEMTPSEFSAFVKEKLGAPVVHYTGNRMVKNVAVVGGGGKDFIYPALTAGADTLLTGEVSYNSVLDAADDGINVIEAGHYFTEAPVLRHLADLCRDLAGAECLYFNSNLTGTV